MGDKIKFAAALLLVALGLIGYYLLSDQALILRVLSVLGGVAAGTAVAWFTEPGQRFLVYGRETVVETKKVVWPGRKETMQTTGVVFAFVVLMAVFLWITDKGLQWVVYDVILGWTKS
ncbi:MAG TPA: preprotein translocase subunit SecE [Rhodocyclaceae bacterium]|nr:MAG: preprotein translocase subunit SecE [Betaproteobacteria bacterium CG2_30_68_42]PIV71476.1 MAG: preprotein translocase subunit SecE [Rhodocyclales bacterium CG17_big_fil_post_rev_8_21_14_2_50_68_7]PJA56841.1 MAG: preprotein translocase subunit SecE [Rhodocyclales bacterium CG_4_9_14_3_um_filter_68_10]HCX32674.1 preprotein translocase subunit SecE [Rhodocyclaceae bacterium]